MCIIIMSVLKEGGASASTENEAGATVAAETGGQVSTAPVRCYNCKLGC